MSLSLLLNSQATTEETLSALSVKTDSIVSVSSLVAEQLPDFVRQDHNRLTEFLEAYYEWMEQTEGTLYSTFVLQDYSDIDSSLSKFITHFRNQYINRFPSSLAFDQNTNSAVDEKRLIKRIKDFYKAKGSEKAYKLLFRILHDAVINKFYYPQTDIIKPSKGNWIIEKSLKVSFNNPDIWNATTVNQFGESGLFIGSATVRNVRKYHTKNATVAELFIDNLNGTFRTDRLNIVTGGTTADFSESVYPVIQNVTVSVSEGATGTTQSGQYYAEGERVKILSDNSGEGAVAEISKVDGVGGILSLSILDSGIGYLPTDTITFDIDTIAGTGAGLTASVGAITDYPGYYFGTDGFPSSNKKIFDNFFYQDFSYEIQTDIALKTYKKNILDLVHPAGTKLFNQLLMKKTHSLENRWKTKAKKLEISVLGHYTPYTFNTTENLRHNSQNVDLYAFGYNTSNALATENGTAGQSHDAVGARTVQYWGLVYNDYDGRTAQSDTNTSEHTYAFDLGSGGTWDSGTTGPLWNGSQQVFLVSDVGTAGASAAYTFVGTADAGDFANNGSYWVIYPHPNVRGITGIDAGITFSSVEMDKFFYIDISGASSGIETIENSFSPGPPGNVLPITGL